MPKQRMTLDPELAAEAKSTVALAFRNGPIEGVHAGKECTTCAGKSEYSHIATEEHHESLRCEFPNMRSIQLLGKSDRMAGASG